MNKFEEAYAEFLKETIWVDNKTKEEIDDGGDPASLTNAQKQKIQKGQYVQKTSPAATSAATGTPNAPVTPGYLDKLKSFGRKVATSVKDVADNPGSIATGLAKIGGYDAREYTKELDIRINNPANLKTFISTPAEPAPQGAANDYFYKLIDIGTPNYEKFVEIISDLNPEAADRFANVVRKLDSTKQNYIEIKSSLPGVGEREKVLVGKIGNNVYAYFPKPVTT